MEMVEIIRALGNSYRLAALEPGSGFLYGRFTFNFAGSLCRVSSGRRHFGGARVSSIYGSDRLLCVPIMVQPVQTIVRGP